MATHANPNSQGASELAPQACSQCRTSKKKCDKTLPSCNRCSRLSLPCLYDEGASIAPGEIVSKFRAVFDRLERLEENVFAPTSSAPSISATAAANDLEAKQWQISPSLIQPSYLDVIAGANLLKVLGEKGLTIREVAQKYFETIHNFMPIISQASLNKHIQEAADLSPTGASMVLIMAITLLIEHPTVQPDGTLGLSKVYQVCKYHFSLFLSLKDPSIELLQAGVFITLYEYAQCIGEHAYITIGNCARMASLLRLHPHSNSRPRMGLAADCFDESANIVIAIQLLTRHIGLSYTMLGKHLSFEYSPIIDAPEASDIGWAADTFGREADACRILNRLQQLLHGDSAVDTPGNSGVSQLDQIIALDAELQSMNISNLSAWQGDFAASTVASLLVFNFLSQQGEPLTATECFSQRHMEIEGRIHMLANMVNDQLSQAMATSNHHVESLTPFSMTILALGADGLQSLKPFQMSERYKPSQQKLFIDLLRCLSKRWRLGEEYLRATRSI